MSSKADEKRTNAYTRASVRSKVEEFAGGATIDYDLGVDGVAPFTFSHPFFYTDEQQAALEDDSDDRPDGEVLLGKPEYDRFIAAGGTGQDITHFLIAVGQDLKAKSDPQKGR